MGTELVCRSQLRSRPCLCFHKLSGLRVIKQRTGPDSKPCDQTSLLRNDKKLGSDAASAFSLLIPFPRQGRTFAPLPYFSFSYSKFKLHGCHCLPFLPLFSQSHKGQLQQQMESLSAGCGGLRSNSWVLLFLLGHRMTARPLFQDSSASTSLTFFLNI